MTILDSKGGGWAKTVVGKTGRTNKTIRRTSSKFSAWIVYCLCLMIRKLKSWLNLTRIRHISYSQRHYPAPKIDQCISQPEESILALQRVKEHC